MTDQTKPPVGRERQMREAADAKGLDLEAAKQRGLYTVWTRDPKLTVAHCVPWWEAEQTIESYAPAADVACVEPMLVGVPVTPYEEYVRRGHEAVCRVHASQWELGDLAAAVETTYKRASLKTWAERIGLGYSSARVYKSVAVAFPESARRLAVPFGVHEALVSMPDAIEQADDERWTVKEAREHVKALEPAKARPALALVPDAAELEETEETEALPMTAADVGEAIFGRPRPTWERVINDIAALNDDEHNGTPAEHEIELLAEALRQFGIKVTWECGKTNLGAVCRNVPGHEGRCSWAKQL